jgi:uncharacterized membrane protein YeaQ/YmgE (transglycosylase-associated protein family)
MQIFILFAIGAVVGLTGRAFTRHRLPGETVISVLLGTAGAMVGAVAGGALGISRSLVEGPGVLVAMLGAMALIYLYSKAIPTKQRA